LLLLLAAAGCHPYFNTFYNAEEAYQVAQRDHRKLMRVFPDSIVVTPSEGMAKQYDRAIEKSLKMMEVYPKDRKHQDRAHLLMGKASFYKKDFPVAVGRMHDLQTHYPQSPLVPESQVYVAKSHIMMDNLNIAEELLLALIREHPQLDRNQEITMLLVEIAMRRGGRSQALALLEGIRKNSSLPLEKRLDIILRMADLNYDLRQYRKALDLLRAAPRSKKHPYLMYRVDRSIYFCLDALDSLEPALAHVTAMQKNRAYADQRYEIMYYHGVTLHRMGRADEAVAILEEIRKMCGKSAGGRADTASLCGRTSYELARIYLERGEYDKAALALEEAGRASDSPVASSASVRLWALKRLKELRTPDSSGKVSAEARYSVAELFRFELETPDSAYYYYMELSADTAAADSLRPRSLLAAAYVARYQKGNAARADSLFKAVIREFDGTEYARRAQIDMDVEVTVVTEREMAEREFRSAEALMENDAVEGVKAFYNVYMDYPDMDIAPRSLHAAAWYTAGVLQKNRGAMTLYEELCEKYPESVYCKTSAAPRLAVARDSIAVRRKRRESASTADSPPAGVVDDDGVSDGAGSGQ
jgi:TolA-binding protein